MQKYRIVIRERVERKMRENYNYLTVQYDNEQAALSHTIDIYRAVKKLDVFPRAHSVVEQVRDIEIRVLRVRRYKLYYYVDEDTKTVHIVEMYHSRQNPDGLELGNVI